MKTLYDIPVNKALIWDYEFTDEEYSTERFFLWYLERVLNYGTLKDVRTMPMEIIRKNLPNLNLRRDIRNFWVSYFERAT